jgi:predicted DNA-binding transcriptional regulator AlpA
MEKSHEFLSEPELADWINIKARTLKYWRKIGRGPKVSPLGGRIRYRRSDVERWIASCSAEYSEGNAA